MKFISRFIIIISLYSCSSTWEPGALVPATVDENLLLPSLMINVAGYNRLIHYRTFGEATNPPLFIMHGSLSDMRSYMPLQELSDRYYVVMWDQRGNGLSERVSRGELSVANMEEEIEQVRSYFCPDRKISILGHSWSAVFVARYLAEYPDKVNQAILTEQYEELSGGLKFFLYEYK